MGGIKPIARMELGEVFVVEGVRKNFRACKRPTLKELKFKDNFYKIAIFPILISISSRGAGLETFRRRKFEYELP